ncbi:MAG: hypothetical protein ACODAA_05810, partial [Gemmatimonadota bacterium]
MTLEVAEALFTTRRNISLAYGTVTRSPPDDPFELAVRKHDVQLRGVALAGNHLVPAGGNGEPWLEHRTGYRPTLIELNPTKPTEGASQDSVATPVRIGQNEERGLWLESHVRRIEACLPLNDRRVSEDALDVRCIQAGRSQGPHALKLEVRVKIRHALLP